MKIGSPKNLEGKNLLVGVSAVDSNGDAIGSDITTLKKGENVTFTSSANGVLVIAAESVESVENATSAVYATNDKNGNDIATTYQTVINDGNKLNGAYVSGAVASATTAANATTVNGLTVSTEVPANAKFTDTIPGSAVLTISVGGVSMGSFNANATTDSSINIPVATSTTYGVVKVEQVVSNTMNAVANNVVSAVSSTMNAHIVSSALHVPAYTTTNNGQVLKISGGVATWDTDLTADGSAVLPNYNATNAGQVLKVNDAGNGTEWSTGATGNMNTADYVNAGGTGVVLSAVNATTVNNHTVSADVPVDAKFTDTIPGSGVLTVSGVGSSLGTFNANASSNATIAIPQATSVVYGLAKVEKVVSNTDNAVANSVVSTVSASLLSAINEHVDTTNIHVPSTGTTGHYLKKTENGNEWASVDIPTFAVDSEITSDGVNAVAGSAIYHMVESRAKIDDLSKVAFTGNYSDLIGAPNDSSINAHIINSAIHVPTGGTSGQVLSLNSNMQPVWVDASSSGESSSSGDGFILTTQKYEMNESERGELIGEVQIEFSPTGETSNNLPVYTGTLDNTTYYLMNANTDEGIVMWFVNNNNSCAGSMDCWWYKNGSDALVDGMTLELGQVGYYEGYDTATLTAMETSSFNTVVSAIASSVASAQIANEVNDATITFTQGGTTKGVFTLNQSTNSTIALDVGGGNITLDSAIASDGANAVVGSAIYNGLASKADVEDLAQVAFTGDYNDLLNKPSETGGGGSITVAGEVTATETNAVAGSAVYNYVSSQMGNISALLAAL